MRNPHSIATHPSPSVAVMRGMTEENLSIGPSGPREEFGRHPGPCTEIQDNTPVAPRVTEPLLQNLFDVLGQLESDLADRWSSLAGHLVKYQPE